MKWYHYIACFFAGLFLANAIPHFVQGITGHSFPTPFSSPPGKGLSSPPVNIYWGLINLVIGYLLFKGGKVAWNSKLALIIFFVAFVFMSILLSIQFGEIMK